MRASVEYSYGNDNERILMYDEDNLTQVFRNEDGEVSRFRFMQYKYELDPETGLPVGGAGTYFRVKVTDERVTVKYMRKHWWRLDQVLGSAQLKNTGDKLEAEDILWLALAAREQRDRDLRAEAQLAEAAAHKRQKKLESREYNARFDGKYPPKKLEAGNAER